MLNRPRGILLGFLFFWPPLAFFLRSSEGFTLPKEIAALAALALGLGSLRAGDWSRLARPWLVRFAFLFFGWMFLDSLAVGMIKREALNGSIHLFLLVGSFALVIYACGRGYSYEKLLQYSLWAGTLVALYGIFQGLGGDRLNWNSQFESRAFSTLGNPNYLGGYLVALLPVSFILILRSRVRTGWLWWRAVTLVIFAGLLMARVRGSEIALAVSLFFLAVVFFTPWGKVLAKENLRFLLVSFAAVAVTGGVFIQRHGGLSSFALSQLSARQRLDTYQVAWEMAKAHPWGGVGLGQLGFQFPRYQAKPFPPGSGPEHPYVYTEHVHNEFLQFLVEGGWPGLLLFLGALAAFAFSVRDFVRDKANQGDDKELLIGVSAGVVAILVQSLTNFPLQIVPTAVLFGLFLAAPLALRGTSSNSVSVRFFSGSGEGPVLLPVILFSFVLIFGAKSIGTSIAFRDTVGETNLGKASHAVYYANRLALLSPGDPKAWAVCAKALELAGMKAQAVGAYQKAVDLNPNDVQSLVDEADLLAQQGKLQDAINLCEKSESIAPNFIGPLWIEAYAYFNLKQYPQAAGYFEKFTQMDPHNDQAFTALGVAYLKSGERGQAKAALEKAVGINPNNQDAVKFLKSLK